MRAGLFFMANMKVHFIGLLLCGGLFVAATLMMLTHYLGLGMAAAMDERQSKTWNSQGLSSIAPA